jgi:signal transduction histidine kinase
MSAAGPTRPRKRKAKRHAAAIRPARKRAAVARDGGTVGEPVEHPGTATDFSVSLEQARLRQVAIQRAKHEWEGTVDALTVLVCLLGRDGQVIRANRVIEDWGLGSVAEAVGRPAHDLLHPRCRRPDCVLHDFAANALGAIRKGSRSQFELQERLGRRHLQITLRPLRDQPTDLPDTDAPMAVLVATDQSALRHAREELEHLNASLEGRVRARTQAFDSANRELRGEIALREQAEGALRRSRNELAALSEQRLSAQEGERKRIAIELHDSVGQSLSAVKYTLERGLELLRQPQRGDPEPVLQLAVRRIQESAESIRAISMNLRPKILDDLGVASAIHWFCREYAETYPGLHVHTEIGVEDQDVPTRLATEVYRCLQELLNNVAKHAVASKVRVRLVADKGALHLEVQDNGVGVDKASPESTRSGSGLRNLRERARQNGGQFSVARGRSGGTTARLSWRMADPRQEPGLANPG